MILIGAKCRLEQTVTEALTAEAIGSGALPVFGTPFMAAMMENAAMTVLRTRGACGESCSVGKR